MNKIFLLLPLLFITSIFSSYDEELLEKATKHYFEKDFKKAYDYSVKALVYYPKHPYAHLYIGTYFNSIGKVDDSIHYFDNAIKYSEEVLPMAHWERVFSKMMVNKDLSYCEDINILKEVIIKDKDYQFLQEEHPIIFGLCEFALRTPKSLINSANFLAQKGSCGYSLLFYNEALKDGTKEELAVYDQSLCK